MTVTRLRLRLRCTRHIRLRCRYVRLRCRYVRGRYVRGRQDEKEKVKVRYVVV